MKRECCAGEIFTTHQILLDLLRVRARGFFRLTRKNKERAEKLAAGKANKWRVAQNTHEINGSICVSYCWKLE